MPVIDWEAPENAHSNMILDAFKKQTPIEIDGRTVIVTDVRFPKGGAHIEYLTKPV